MPITIQAMSEERRLRVSGDMDMELSIPAEPPRSRPQGEQTDCYYISLSDGTLIRARLAEEPDYEVIVEGAGIVEVNGATKRLNVAWSIEWISLSPASNAMAVAQRSPHSLPLFLPRLENVAVSR